MIDEKNMRAMLEKMESAAEEALSRDPAFYEVLKTLKAEIDRNPRVQSAISNLRATGRRVQSSLVPHIRVRIRTNQGEIALPGREQLSLPLAEPIAQLTQELRNAASAVIMRGRYREELDHIMNEAVCASARFEGIASAIESAGYEVVICLDVSAYSQVREPAEPAQNAEAIRNVRKPERSDDRLCRLLSSQDLKFLKALKIRALEN